MDVPGCCLSSAARRAGSCLCAFNRRKPFFASIIAAAVQRIAMDGERQRLTLRLLRRWIAMTIQEREAMAERAYRCFHTHYDMRENAKAIIKLFENATVPAPRMRS